MFDWLNYIIININSGDYMELINKKDYYNGDSDSEYKLDSIDSKEDIIKIINTLEKEYGLFEEIICVKKDINDQIIFYEEYHDISKFSNSFKIDNFGIIICNCKDKYIDFILENKTLRVLDRQNTLGEKKYDINKVKYYKDRYNNIIKYDGNNGMFYLLDMKINKFVVRNDLASSFYGDGDYIEIDYNENNKLTDIHR